MDRAQPERSHLLLPVEGPVSVNVIPQNGMPQRRQVGPDLVGSPGIQMHPQPGDGPARQRLIPGYNFAASGQGRIGNAYPALLCVLGQIRATYRLRRLWKPANEAFIILLQPVKTKNVLQNQQGIFIFCYYS